jgi:putative acetyltransferase
MIMALMSGCKLPAAATTIRQATANDHGDMLEIWLKASRIGHPFLGEEVLLEQQALLRSVYLPLAESWLVEAGRPIGFMSLLGAYIGGLFVDPDAMRSGVGRQLIMQAASLLGKLRVEVYEANLGARAFYASMGFRIAGRKPKDDAGRSFPLLKLVRAADSVCAARQA